MAYVIDTELPPLLGPDAALRKWSRMLRDAQSEHLRLAAFCDSWGIGGGGFHGPKWLGRFRMQINSLLYGLTMREWVVGVLASGYSVSANEGPICVQLTGDASATLSARDASEKWPSMGAKRLPYSTHGLHVRILRYGQGGMHVIGQGSIESVWATDNTPFHLEIGVNPIEDAGDVLLRWFKATGSVLDKDYQAPFTNLTLDVTETIGGTDTAGGTDIRIVTSDSYEPDWDTGNPVFDVRTANDGGEAVDFQFVRIISERDGGGIAIDPWANSGHRLGGESNCFQVTHQNIGPLFGLQNYGGVICWLGFNDIFGDAASESTVKGRLESFIAYIRGIAGWDIPILVGMNPCASTTAYAESTYDTARLYPDIAREVAEEDGTGTVAVLNMSRAYATRGITKRSQRFAVQDPPTDLYEEGVAVTEGDVVWGNPPWDGRRNGEDDIAYLANEGHTTSSSNYPGSGGLVDFGSTNQLPWRNVTKINRNVSGDGIHPTEQGGAMVAECMLQMFSRLMAYSATSGGGGGGGAGRIISG